MSWWCVAWSEELKGKPLAVRVGNEEIVLFRNATGAVCACEDRCAHRRVPLSMGWVTPKGSIQCGYHGWCYDGQSGQCVEIPNFRPDEPISPRVKVRVFSASEINGAIFVDVGSEAEASLSAPSITKLDSAAGAVVGQVEIPVPHSVWIENLIADPIAALGLNLLKAEGAAGQPKAEKSSVVVEQKVRSTAAGDASKQVLQLRFEVWALTGLAQLILRDSNDAVQLNLVISSLPLAAERTVVRWRLLDEVASGVFTAVLRKLVGRAPEPIKIRNNVVRISPPHSAVLLWRDLLADEQLTAHRIHVSEEH
ncbi:MAG: (2Fe-2S)-binding protein [Verrucomicrobiaceae bacterium]|nr:(2Fe-2S)-binding protein [Verrucomicrobiaceae bacterium]